jgi:isoleucyl-tRNA synthetase
MSDNKKQSQPVKRPSILPSLEEAILSFWQKENIFKRSIEERPEDKPFVFYDGPPYATGKPHIGTLLASSIKDVIPRYKTMKGYRVERRFGWDCHGLPIEVMVEKELGLNSRKEIEELGIEKFNQACRDTVMRYVDIWKEVVTRTGRWVDFENDYKTMDVTFMESAIWVFKKLYDNGLVYEDFRSSLYCTRCETPLSKMETGNESYQDVSDPSVFIGFKITNEDNKYFLAWTTTPWTLSANVALAVGEDIEYAEVKILSEGAWKDRVVVLAKARLETALKDFAYKELNSLTGKDLVGKKYEPIQQFIKPEGEAYKVVSANFVSTEDGTGIVHIAPAFGEDDFELSKTAKLPVLLTINDSGKFLDEVQPYAGLHVKEADKKIIADLETAGSLLRSENITHSYPFCWRCKNPLIYKVQKSTFIRVSAVKEKMLETNQQINWIPEYLKDGRFGKGLASAPDWNVSRKRYWGIPVPIWKCDRCDRSKVLGSLDEIEQVSGSRPTDLHRPLIDQVSWACQCGGTFERVADVCDVWFDSGCMPYSQVHYPFENKEKFETTFPADFIGEGLDQTRGWFYTLHVLSNALFEKPAFKNVLVNGLVMAEDGTKMSKSKGNMPDSMEILNQYGADALRLYMLGSGVTHADPVNFLEADLDEVLKKALLPLLNVYSFFALYAPKEGTVEMIKEPKHVLDKWVLAKLENLRAQVEAGMENYELWKAVKPISEFVNDLSTWYVRRSRDRFKGEDEADKNKAVQTLFTVLLETSKIIAPFTPFVAEHIYQKLKPLNSSGLDSVHLELWPEAMVNRKDEKLITEMNIGRDVVNKGHALRRLHDLKVRQPMEALIEGRNLDTQQQFAMRDEIESIIYEELNFRKGVFDIPPYDTNIIVENYDDYRFLINTVPTQELKQEGIRRELVRMINNQRKNEGFTIENRAKIVYETTDAEIKAAIEGDKNMILKETLADEIIEGTAETVVKINGIEIKLTLRKV